MDKETLRKQIISARKAEADKDEKSERIADTLLSLPEFKKAKTILFYVNTGSEVQTRTCIQKALSLQKTVLVPYCVGDELLLWRLSRLSELEPGAYGILEPKIELREKFKKFGGPSDVELAIVPGVAFDKKGGRLGRGRGFYDRFLGKLREETCRIGFSFECQLVEEIPEETHDMRVHKVITEKYVYGSLGLGCYVEIASLRSQ